PPPDIRRQWETLWLADDSATAYDNPEFITGTVAMGMPKGRTAQLLQFRNGAQLVGALPLSRWQVGLGWPRYTLWDVPALGRTGLQVLLCHPDRQAEVVAAARGWFESQLQSGSGFWQNWMLED